MYVDVGLDAIAEALELAGIACKFSTDPVWYGPHSGWLRTNIISEGHEVLLAEDDYHVAVRTRAVALREDMADRIARADTGIGSHDVWVKAGQIAHDATLGSLTPGLLVQEIIDV